jgi:2-hydroxy-3-keto-5-methylthiopentenyl-1-phosphate phosphatase
MTAMARTPGILVPVTAGARRPDANLPPVKPLLIACDFDGTATSRDTLHVIIERYGTRGIWEELEPRLRAGEITIEEAMEREFRGVRATFEEARDLVLHQAPLRPGFGDFVAWSRERGHRLVIFSNGFRCIIEAVLDHGGVEGVQVMAHDARFSPEGTTIVWSERGDLCDLCGRRCKRHDLGNHRRDEPVVYLGDGISDRCAIRAADVAFARDGLAEYLAAEEVAFLPFRDFHDVRRALERPLIAAA